MSLLRPRHERGPDRLSREFTVLRCPHNGMQVSWCRALCTPIENRGTCGRFAAHTMADRTQKAISVQLSRRPGTGRPRYTVARGWGHEAAV